MDIAFLEPKPAKGMNLDGSMKEAGAQKYVGAVENCIKILRHLAYSGGAEGVASIARATEINVSTAFNILRTLAKEEIISFNQNDKTYELSLGVLEFSLPLIGRSQTDLIRPVISQLGEKYQLLIAMWTVTPDERIVLQSKSVSENVVRIELRQNSRLPAYAGAIGRCYASKMSLSDAELQTKYETINWFKAPGIDTYLKDVAAARKDGFALDLGKLFSGVDMAASLICDSSGRPALGLSGISLTGRFSKKEMRDIGRDISKTCQFIEQRLFPA